MLRGRRVVSARRPPVVILCGGRGTRLHEGSRAPAGGVELPKPLVEIGGKPIVWHVVMLYAAQGFTRFVLATGFGSVHVDSFVAGERWPARVSVTCIDTGEDTQTGGRVGQVREHLSQDERICVTYCDGLADVDLQELLAFHECHGALATVTVVRPQLQFGVAELARDGRVVGFREKPRSEHWVNGGFFCFEQAALEGMREDSVLERAPLELLAAAGELRAHRHTGFWRCMDTYKDAVALNELWGTGRAPWKLWEPIDAPPASPPARPRDPVGAAALEH